MNMKVNLRILLIIIGVFLFSGCAEILVDPAVPVGLLSKSRDYLFFCLSIIDSSKPLYNQVAGRYYYAMFSIAKISSIWKHKHFSEEMETHEEVWRVAPSEPRKVFGKELKSLRTDCDYMHDCNDSSSDKIKIALKPIIADDDAYNKLVEDVRENLLKYYEVVEPHDDESEKQCVDIITEISNCRKNIMNLLKQ